MMRTTLQLFRTSLTLFALVMVSAIAAQDTSTSSSSSSSFQCGVLDDKNVQDISSTTSNNNNNFDTINVNYDVNWFGSSNNRRHIMPQRTNWHIYAISDEQGPARFSSIPKGLIKPKVNGNTLVFPVQKDALYNLGYTKGDSVEAAVNLFIPLSQLRKIQISGVNDFVEIIVSEDALLWGEENGTLATNSSTASSSSLRAPPTIDIRSSGVDTRLYVNTPYSKVNYDGSGVDNTAIIDAGTNSSVVVSGVGHNLSIQSDYLKTVQLSGVDQDLLIEGSYRTLSLSGVDCRVRVHGGETGCNAIDASSGGVNTNCRLTNDTVIVPTLDCVAESKTIYQGVSTGATVGIALASLLVLCLCVALCAFCCCGGRRCGSRQVGRQNEESSYPPKPNGATTDVPVGSWVEEAEVIEIEPTPAAAYAVVLPDPEQPLPPSNDKNGSSTFGGSLNAKPYG